jgi:DNA-binding NarL/FixJ family response regulator
MARIKTIVTMLEDGMDNDQIQAALNTDRPTVSRSLVETFRKTWEETTHLTRINEKDTER